jgi:hypothetical protein
MPEEWTPERLAGEPDLGALKRSGRLSGVGVTGIPSVVWKWPPPR